ncbi:MAG: hypothetical protein FWH41_09910, partial [Treponema sp.]|nr:hypothetical protein [Treponema sp.]
MTKPNTAKPEMAKPLLVLFVIKIGLYLSTASLVIFHPGIAVPFDRTGILLWFVIIPLEMIVAFLPAPAGKMRWKLLIALGLMLIVLAVNGGLGYETLLIMGAGVISFILNYLLFYQSRFGKLSALEPFFLAWITLRLLAFSRSGEEAAGLSAAITPFILVWAPIVFLLQSAVVFLCLNPPGIKGIKKEAVSGLLACLLAVIALAVIL